MFEDLFDFTDIEKKTQELLTNKYGKARANVEAGFGGVGREAQANLDIQAQRQGIMGSSLASTLSSRLAADLGQKKNQALAGVDMAEASDTANLGIQNAINSNNAKAQMLSGITSGIFSGLGTLAGKIFPAKVA